jgi:hypothetical protein
MARWKFEEFLHGIEHTAQCILPVLAAGDIFHVSVDSM